MTPLTPLNVGERRPRPTFVVRVFRQETRLSSGAYRYRDTALADAKEWIAHTEQNGIKHVTVTDPDGSVIFEWSA